MATKEIKKTYEEAIQRLEEIVEKLDSGAFTLDESMSLFQEGVALTKYCNAKLNEYEKTITKLVEKQGELIEEKFDE
ncbi:MAG: exodeoxyribonuclease VII small subunit [Clostridia bacterium]